VCFTESMSVATVCWRSGYLANQATAEGLSGKDVWPAVQHILQLLQLISIHYLFTQLFFNTVKRAALSVLPSSDLGSLV
jgi:hypothetical protein